MMAVSNRMFSLGILGLAFILGSFNTVQLLPTMDEMEYSQAGYFTVTNQDRSRQIWNGEPMIFYQGRPELIERGPLYNVTSRELMAWSDIIFDYREYLSERGVQLSLILEGRNGVIKVGICDLTEEKAQLFVDIMKHYVPMGVIILQNATIIKITGRFGDLDYSESSMQLRLDVITDKTEYACGEKITAECVIINDSPNTVRTTPPTVFSATGYTVNSTIDERVSQGIFITWAESEIEIPANASTVLCSFHFISDEPGPFLISISGFPEKEVMIVEPDSGSPLSLPVSVKLNKNTFSVNDEAELIFINRGSKDASCGSRYDIERLEGEEWIEVTLSPSPSAWTAILKILPAWGTTRQKIKIDTLEPGHYRVHKKVNIEGGKATFTLEFDIRDEG